MCVSSLCLVASATQLDFLVFLLNSLRWGDALHQRLGRGTNKFVARRWRCLGCGGKVLLGLGGIGHHGLLAGLPVGWAHLAILVGILECLDQAQCLLNAAAHWQIVDGYLAQILLVIDDEEAAEWYASGLIQYTVIACHLHRFVGQQWNVHVAQAALFACGIDPGQVGELAVCGAANQFAIDLTELGRMIRERNYLGRAHKGEVQWIEEQHQVFALVVAQLDVLELSTHHGGAGEIGSGLLDLGHLNKVQNKGQKYGIIFIRSDDKFGQTCCFTDWNSSFFLFFYKLVNFSLPFVDFSTFFFCFLCQLAIVIRRILKRAKPEQNGGQKFPIKEKMDARTE